MRHRYLTDSSSFSYRRPPGSVQGPSRSRLVRPCVNDLRHDLTDSFGRASHCRRPGRPGAASPRSSSSPYHASSSGVDRPGRRSCRFVTAECSCPASDRSNAVSEHLARRRARRAMVDLADLLRRSKRTFGPGRSVGGDGRWETLTMGHADRSAYPSSPPSPARPTSIRCWGGLRTPWTPTRSEFPVGEILQQSQ